jgi:hypothetical protein
MVKVEINGQIVEFDKMPSDEDIDDAARQMGSNKATPKQTTKTVGSQPTPTVAPKTQRTPEELKAMPKIESYGTEISATPERKKVKRGLFSFLFDNPKEDMIPEAKRQTPEQLEAIRNMPDELFKEVKTSGVQSLFQKDMVKSKKNELLMDISDIAKRSGYDKQAFAFRERANQAEQANSMGYKVSDTMMKFLIMGGSSMFATTKGAIPGTPLNTLAQSTALAGYEGAKNVINDAKALELGRTKITDLGIDFVKDTGTNFAAITLGNIMIGSFTDAMKDPTLRTIESGYKNFPKGKNFSYEGLTNSMKDLFPDDAIIIAQGKQISPKIVIKDLAKSAKHFQNKADMLTTQVEKKILSDKSKSVGIIEDISNTLAGATNPKDELMVLKEKFVNTYSNENINPDAYLSLKEQLEAVKQSHIDDMTNAQYSLNGLLKNVTEDDNLLRSFKVDEQKYRELISNSKKRIKEIDEELKAGETKLIEVFQTKTDATYQRAQTEYKKMEESIKGNLLELENKSLVSSKVVKNIVSGIDTKAYMDRSLVVQNEIYETIPQVGKLFKNLMTDYGEVEKSKYTTFFEGHKDTNLEITDQLQGMLNVFSVPESKVSTIGGKTSISESLNLSSPVPKNNVMLTKSGGKPEMVDADPLWRLNEYFATQEKDPLIKSWWTDLYKNGKIRLVVTPKATGTEEIIVYGENTKQDAIKAFSNPSEYNVKVEMPYEEVHKFKMHLEDKMDEVFTGTKSRAERSIISPLGDYINGLYAKLGTADPQYKQLAVEWLEYKGHKDNFKSLFGDDMVVTEKGKTFKMPKKMDEVLSNLAKRASTGEISNQEALGILYNETYKMNEFTKFMEQVNGGAFKDSLDAIQYNSMDSVYKSIELNNINEFLKSVNEINGLAFTDIDYKKATDIADLANKVNNPLRKDLDKLKDNLRTVKEDMAITQINIKQAKDAYSDKIKYFDFLNDISKKDPSKITIREIDNVMKASSEQTDAKTWVDADTTKKTLISMREDVLANKASIENLLKSYEENLVTEEAKKAHNIITKQFNSFYNKPIQELTANDALRLYETARQNDELFSEEFAEKLFDMQLTLRNMEQGYRDKMIMVAQDYQGIDDNIARLATERSNKPIDSLSLSDMQTMVDSIKYIQNHPSSKKESLENSVGKIINGSEIQSIFDDYVGLSKQSNSLEIAYNLSEKVNDILQVTTVKELNRRQLQDISSALTQIQDSVAMEGKNDKLKDLNARLTQTIAGLKKNENTMQLIEDRYTRYSKKFLLAKKWLEQEYGLADKTGIAYAAAYTMLGLKMGAMFPVFHGVNGLIRSASTIMNGTNKPMPQIIETIEKELSSIMSKAGKEKQSKYNDREVKSFDFMIQLVKDYLIILEHENRKRMGLKTNVDLAVGAGVDTGKAVLDTAGDIKNAVSYSPK